MMLNFAAYVFAFLAYYTCGYAFQFGAVAMMLRAIIHEIEHVDGLTVWGCATAVIRVFEKIAKRVSG